MEEEEKNIAYNLLGVNNIVIGLLVNMLKKNQTYHKEGFAFSNKWTEIELDVSGFNEKLIESSIEELSNSKKYTDEKSQTYYLNCVCCSIYNVTDKIIKLNIAKELFVNFRSELLKLK